jgi:hypothetical protein
VDKALKANYVDCFGGSDRALDSFQTYKGNQLCYDFSDHGGIEAVLKIDKFQPRSLIWDYPESV